MCLNFAAKVGNVCYNMIKQTFHLCYKSAVCTTGQGHTLPYTLNIMGAHAIVYNAAGTPCVYKRPPFAFQKTAFYRLKGHLLQGKRRPSTNTLAVSTLQDVQKDVRKSRTTELHRLAPDAGQSALRQSG